MPPLKLLDSFGDFHIWTQFEQLAKHEKNINKACKDLNLKLLEY